MERTEALRIFGGGLASFMDRKGYQQKDIAEFCELTISTVSTMQSGKSAPSFKSVCILVEKGMSLDEIFGAELAQKLAADYQRTAVRKEPLTAARQAKEILKLLLNELEKMPGGDQ